MVQVARTSKVDSVVLYNYAFASRRLGHLEYDTIKAIIHEGINYANSINIENEYTFQLKYADITSDFLVKSPSELIRRIHQITPLSLDLPLPYRIRIYRHLGSFYKSSLRFDSAIYYYDLGIKAAQKSNNTLDVIQFKSLLALTYHEGGNTEVGLDLLGKINRDYPSAIESYHFRRAFVIINNSAGLYQQTIDLFRKIKKTHNDTVMVLSYPSVTNAYPEALYQQGKITLALEEAKKYLKIQVAGSGKISSYHYLFTMAKCYLVKGQPKRALASVEEARKNSQYKSSINKLRQYVKIKCEAYIALGAKDSAQLYLEKYVKIEKEEAISLAKLKYQQTLVAYQTKEMENKVVLMAKKTELDKSQFNYLLLVSALLLLGVSMGIFAFFKRKQEKTKTALVEAELTSIRSQMNPHFMFNALNSIKSYIIKEEPKLAAEYLSRFASLIRRILDLSSQKRISLKEELEMLDLYVAMEQLRFQNKFDYRVQSRINVASHDTMVPPLFIQPFIENAIKHGLSPLSGRKGLLELIIEQNGNNLIFIVRDNGIGRQIRSSEHNSKGVSLSLQRMQLWNDKSNIKRHLEIIDLENGDDESSAAGTEVRIELVIKSKL